MNELKIFSNQEFGDVRTIVEDDKILFCASDVASALGYSNISKAINDHCPHVTKRYIGVETGRKADGTPAIQNVQMNFIPEGDIFRLVVRSKLPTAIKFEGWVFDDVIPSIRKHGAYLTPDKIEEVLTNPDTIIRLATELKQEREAKQKVLVALEQVNKELEEAKPKLTYYDTILNSVGTMTSSQIGADYGMSAIKLNRILNEQKLIKKVNNQWILYVKYQNQGLTESKTFDVEHGSIIGSYVSTRWTQKGRLKIHEILTKLGYVANVDKSINRLSKRDKFIAQETARQLSHIA